MWFKALGPQDSECFSTLPKQIRNKNQSLNMLPMLTEATDALVTIEMVREMKMKLEFIESH